MKKIAIIALIIIILTIVNGCGNTSPDDNIKHGDEHALIYYYIDAGGVKHIAVQGYARTTKVNNVIVNKSLITGRQPNIITHLYTNEEIILDKLKCPIFDEDYFVKKCLYRLR